MTRLSTADVTEGLRPVLHSVIRLGDGPAVFERVVIDSREVRPGDLFVALAGERDDGHRHAADAAARGAAGLIVSRLPARPSGHQGGQLCVFLVEDTLAALQSLAASWRRRWPAEVVGITGSVGKTTTKELTATVLAARGPVLKNEGNLNNEIGLPLTALSLDEHHCTAVMEMGTYGPGEISTLCHIARPLVGIVTCVEPVHLERMGSMETIARAKAELVCHLPEDGCAVLNADDERVAAMASLARGRVLTYGLSPQADVRASDVESRGLDGISFVLHFEGLRQRLFCPLPGRHNVRTALAAAAAALHLGLPLDQVSEGIAQGTSPLRLIPKRTANGALVLDDTYNSSPASALAALDLLAELPGRRLAVLGDMLELGSHEEEGHRLVGRRAAEVVDELVLVGPLARLIGEEAEHRGLKRAAYFADNDAAAEHLASRLEPGDCVLIKGSRSLTMEEIVARVAPT